MGLLEKLANPLKSLSDWQRQQTAAADERRRQEEEQLQKRRELYMEELLGEFKDAERMDARPYRELTIGEAKMGRTPAVEYFINTGAVRLHALMHPDMMRQASLIDPLGLRLDDVEEGEIGAVLDVKRKDMESVEYGAVHLGAVA